jgi:hypothetical protein
MAKKLISVSQINSIKSALEDVTYTFHNTPVLYKEAVESIDRFNEDRSDLTFNEHSILALVEYPKNGKFKREVAGITDLHDIMLQFNTVDFSEQNLLDSNGYVTLDGVKDFFIVENVTYKVDKVLHDGYLDSRPILFIVVGSKYKP